ncbi:MAG: DUF1800 domain-containing protein [Planctomycetes bacterium]|nr:DUF1800 domain-containing protein [Planctomycetota bacterium]MBI3844368.1 DUF1800 domain-containing protein [Planctomycetota bacterium]
MIDGDAKKLLEPFEPSAEDPWDRAKAAHLLRRGGFGGTALEIDAALKAGPEGAVHALAEGDECDAYRDTLALGDVIVASNDLESLQAWWLLRCVRAGRPLREKIALFWHGHFATSLAKVERARLMLRQNRLFLERGLGPFEELLQAVSRDPAMLVWLDSNDNRRGKPNENYARELMELFSLGLGNYAEGDVKEAARAFTGWHVQGGEFFFDADKHDAGSKTVFGKSGAWDGGDVVAMCARRPECAAFLARKLFEFFVHPEPDPALVAALGESLRARGLRIGDWLASLLQSRAFYSRRARRAVIKSPVDFAVGLVRVSGATVDGKAMARAVASMGQSLFAPPTVKGWDGGRHWISAAALLARVNFAAAVSRSPKLDAFGDGSVDALLAAFVDGPIPAPVRDRLAAHVAPLHDPDTRMRTLIRTIASLPESHLC